MDKNNKNNDDEKLHISRSVFENARDIQQKKSEEENLKQQELQKKLAERERKKREERDKRLEEERKELIRLKQGIIQESEIIHEEQPEEIKLSFFKKIGNFFYHSKWWLGMGLAVAFIVVFLTISLVNKPRPDMIILFIAENQTVCEESDLDKYIASFSDDNNNNGETLVSLYYIPYTDNPQKNYANGVDTKLTAELQSADSVIVFGNNKIEDVLNPDDVFVDLSKIYPDNPNVDGYKFMVENTDIAEKIGVDKKDVKDGLFIALRQPRKLMYSSKYKMQETYDRDFKVFDKIVNDLSE